MAQEYFINSQELENKIRQLLPSQGGSGAGVDLSASTQIVPIIDLTEQAEGSNVRQDLQTAFSFKSVTSFAVSNTTTDIVNNTGYYRIFGAASNTVTGSAANSCRIRLTDGVTTKDLFDTGVESQFGSPTNIVGTSRLFDFVVYVESGQIIQAISGSTSLRIVGCTRQIATVDGTLVNP